MATFFRPPRFLIRERAAPRQEISAPVQVVCYRCARSSTHSPFAESASCPHCAGRLVLGDVHVEGGHWGSSIQTTGSVTIDEHAQLSANLVICSGDMVLAGKIHAMCICGGTARVCPTAEIQGGIRAAKMVLEEGAVIRGSLIETRSNAIGTIDVDAAMRCAPGKGQASEIQPKPIASPQTQSHDIAARIYPTSNGARPTRIRAI